MATEAERISKTRTRLLLQFPWFGTLSLRLRIIEDDKVGTLATDGTRLYYSPKFTAGLNDGELLFTVAHETMHCAMLHPYRIQGREHQRWNVACDLAINPLLRAAGLPMPNGALDDPKYHGMSAEQIYSALPNDPNYSASQSPEDMKPAGQDGDKDGHSHGQQPGQSGSTPSDGPDMTATDWQVMAEQAAGVARRAGKMPADIDRAIGETHKSVVDWRTLLRRFVEQTMPSDYSWTHPNRRYIADGLYLPGVVKENTPKIAVAIDTSGSITGEMLTQFASELSAIMYEVRPVELDVVYCDARLQAEETFTPDGGPVELHAKGGGGTAFQPVFDWLAEQGEPPACLIYATDLENSDGTPTKPDMPVMWLTPEWVRQEGPFGETVRLNHPSEAS